MMRKALVAGSAWVLSASLVVSQTLLLPQDLSPENLDTSGFVEEPLPRLQDRVTRRAAVAEPVLPGTGAVLRGLDRIAGTVEDLELQIGGTAEYADRLTITLQDCRVPEDDPASNAYAYLSIRDRLRDEPVFEGWMVAASPALNAMDHARYDVWVLRCISS